MKTPTWPYLYNAFTYKYIMIKRPEGRCVIFAKLSHYTYLSPTTFGIAILFFCFLKLEFKIIQQFHFQYSREMSFLYLEMLEIPWWGVCFIEYALFLWFFFWSPWNLHQKRNQNQETKHLYLWKKKYLHPRIFPVKVCLLRWMPVLVW